MRSRPAGSPLAKTIGLGMWIVFAPAAIALLPGAMLWRQSLPVEGTSGRLLADFLVHYLNLPGAAQPVGFGTQGRLADARWHAFLARPKGVAVDSDNNLYVMDSIFGNFQIFNPKGQLLLYVGQEGYLPGEMMLPSGIFIDKDDRIYVADTFNHRLQIFQYLKERVQQ